MLPDRGPVFRRLLLILYPLPVLKASDYRPQMVSLLWLLMMMAVAAVSNSSREDDQPAFPDPPPRSIQARKAVDLPSWHYDQLVGSYLSHGHRDPAWDADATNALGAFAAFRAGVISEKDLRTASITDFTAAAFGKGCSDPLLRYLHWRRRGTKMAHTTDILEIADGLDASGYPAVLTSYAFLRAFEVLYPRPSTNQVSPYAMRARQAALDRFKEALNQQDLPGIEVLELGRPVHRMLGAPSLTYHPWSPIEQTLIERYSDVAEAQLLLGEAGITDAWRARGGGYADSVTEEGWRLFDQRLRKSDRALRRAWQLDPTLPEVPWKMITVCLGLGHPRPEMEKWFDRARNLSSGWYDLYSAKGQFLMPKWHGSVSEVLKFGRECLTDTNAVGRTRLMIVDFHEELEAYHRPHDASTGERSRRGNRTYFRDPRVWNDIRSAFEVFFHEVPDSAGWHHNYALHAWRAEDWKTLNAEIPKLGPINYKYFGGRDAFEQMLADAKAHEGP